MEVSKNGRKTQREGGIVKKVGSKKGINSFEKCITFRS
jgi:hypothetical protein